MTIVAVVLLILKQRMLQLLRLLLRQWCISVNRDLLLLKKLHCSSYDIYCYPLNLVLILVGAEHQFALHKHLHAFSGILFHDFRQPVPGGDSQPQWFLVFPLVNCQGKLGVGASVDDRLFRVSAEPANKLALVKRCHDLFFSFLKWSLLPIAMPEGADACAFQAFLPLHVFSIASPAVRDRSGKGPATLAAGSLCHAVSYALRARTRYTLLPSGAKCALS